MNYYRSFSWAPLLTFLLATRATGQTAILPGRDISAIEIGRLARGGKFPTFNLKRTLAQENGPIQPATLTALVDTLVAIGTAPESRVSNAVKLEVVSALGTAGSSSKGISLRGSATALYKIAMHEDNSVGSAAAVNLITLPNYPAVEPLIVRIAESNLSASVTVIKWFGHPKAPARALAIARRLWEGPTVKLEMACTMLASIAWEHKWPATAATSCAPK